jgi:hypothetical protein
MFRVVEFHHQEVSCGIIALWQILCPEIYGTMMNDQFV